MFLTHLLVCLTSLLTPIHEGPDPIGSWSLSKTQIKGQTLQSMLGVPGRIEGKALLVGEKKRETLWFDGKTTRVVLADDFAKSKQKLPTKHLTIEAWVAVNERQRWGGILSVLQDNGHSEKGWILGFDQDRFSFGLASKGADDGDGKMTFLRASSRYEEGRLYHLVATYDGAAQRLYVNGKLEGESQVQSGDILYPPAAPLVIGGYFDDDESFYFKGRIPRVRLFDQTAKANWVQGAFAHDAALSRSAPLIRYAEEFEWVVHPYLQWATRDGMTVRWETTRPATAVLKYGPKVSFEGERESAVAVFESSISTTKAALLGEIRIDGLKEDSAYYYQLELTDDRRRTIRSAISSFQTAPGPDVPFAFAVISDTQTQPKVAAKIAQDAWALRPNFVLHPGDLVNTGSVKREWVQEFFGSMKPLFERVAFFPVLGNHEQDARFYYDYMSLPDPEYYYSFRYGNAQFFMLDSNREVGPGSEQYRFLERGLKSSKAEWKIVCYHHPAYSSDENDFGNTWYGPSTRGDLRTRQLVPLFDRYGVDIVWNGHIHSYERTWPLEKGRATAANRGTVYMITGGAGGPLERAGPIRPFFQNTVKRAHHFCFVAVNGKTLEMKAYDLEGRLFDTMKIEKK